MLPIKTDPIALYNWWFPSGLYFTEFTILMKIQPDSQKMCCGGINPTRNIIAIQQGAIIGNETVVKGYLVT